MRFLDICLNLGNPPGGPTPYLLIVQGDYVSVQTTRVVVPLMRLEAVSPIVTGGLMPIFTIETIEVAMVTPELAGIPVQDIGPVVAGAQDRHLEVRRAIDILTGDL
jgi:hypothetical protein